MIVVPSILEATAFRSSPTPENVTFDWNNSRSRVLDGGVAMHCCSPDHLQEKGSFVAIEAFPASISK